MGVNIKKLDEYCSVPRVGEAVITCPACNEVLMIPVLLAGITVGTEVYADFAVVRVSFRELDVPHECEGRVQV